MIKSIIQALFFIIIQPNMSEQEKWQRIKDLLYTKTRPKFLCLPYTRQRKIIFTEKELFKEKGKIEQKTKRLFNCSHNSN